MCGNPIKNNNNSRMKNDEQEQQQHHHYQRPPNAYQHASFLSKLFFTWPYPLLRLGMQQSLSDDDLPDVAQDTDSSKANLEYFQRIWQEEQRKHPTSPSLRRAILKEYFRKTVWLQPLMLAAYTAKVVQSVALGYLINFFEGQNSNGFFWASVLVGCAFIILFAIQHMFLRTWNIGMQFRLACVAAIYDKSLKLSSTASSSSSSGEGGASSSSSFGQVMNLCSNDVERFILAALFANHLIWCPLQSIAVLILGWSMLGPAFAFGWGLLLVVIVPLQSYLSRKFAFYRSRIAAMTDQRVTCASQAVRGARIMKMNGYERRFEERIQDYRRQEMAQIVKANSLKAWNEALFFSSNVIIPVLIFTFHVHVLGRSFTTGDVFTVFTLINILQIEMTKHVSLGVMGVSECYVSIGRIQNFLESPELSKVDNDDAGADDDTPDTNASINVATGAVATGGGGGGRRTPTDGEIIRMSHVNAYWDTDAKKKKTTATNTPPDDIVSHSTMALRDISISFHKGQLVAIIGSVGSGKSALLQTIVQELPITSGSIQRRLDSSSASSISYAPQDTWIMNGTVQENILMGQTFDKDWYDRVIAACGLVPDLQLFIKGDLSIVGDRGVQCSGGQRARIGLARALYRDADVLVVDDPLSAVDPKVGRHLFHQALLGLALRRGKCVILATHQHQYVQNDEDNNFSHKCVLMEGGGVTCIGTYDECIASSDGKLVRKRMSNDNLASLAEEESQKSIGKGTSRGGADEKETVTTISDENNKVPTKTNDDNAKAGKNDDGNDENDNQEEMTFKGLVKGATYWEYLKAMGGVWVAIFFLTLFCCTQGSVLVSIFFLGKWAEMSPMEQQTDYGIMGLVIGLAGCVILLSLARAFLSFYFTLKASQRLHDKMTKAVLRAKITFFDTNPLGRIMNRFSADVGSNDDLLPATLYDFSMLAFIVLGALISTFTSLPYTLLAIPPILWYFLRVRTIFVTSTRELKRLEGLARSPIFAMLSESLSGIATIRANNAVPFFQEKFQNVHDGHTRAFSAFIAASRWIGFRMDTIVVIFLTLASYLTVTSHVQGWFDADPAIVGLALSLLLQLAGLFQWCVRQSAEVVNQMVSVERVVAFGNDLESEAPLVRDGDAAILEKGWPTGKNGSIQAQSLAVRYRPSLPLALNNVNFTIPGGSRVGIVGRTGSGKSTIVQTLFRLLEAEKGCIMIDGVDIAKLGLHTLRTRISVIPQMPTLFSGCSVRENLDLFNLHSDESLRKVLEDCRLTQVIADLPNGWDSPVAEGGSNFSVGQRQLLCLARAILSKNKIIVLDEATASVDQRTDQLLQEALYSAALRDTAGGGNSTILAVAHRLDTVIESDLILVLGPGGEVLEFDSPATLLMKDGGAFASMVDDSGEAMATELRQRAFSKKPH